MKTILRSVIILNSIISSITVYAVDIGNFEELNCDWNELMITCSNHQERVCCGFPQRGTSTWSVGYRGLGEGDIATWFHEGPALPNGATNHCGGLRRSQVMMGDIAGEICMSVGHNEPFESNDGANWRRGAKVNKIAQILMVDSKYGAIDATFNGQSLVGSIGARDLEQKEGEEAKCIARRYAEVIAFEQGEGATGAWHLPGSPENHKRYTNTVQNNPGKSNAEILALAGASYYEDWKRDPYLKAARLGEPVPAIARRSLMDMIRSGELEENKITLAMAAAELDQQTLVPRQDPTDDSFLWIEAEEEQKRDVIPDSFPWIEAEEEQKRDVVPDSFPWIEVEEEQKRDVVLDSFPWIEAEEEQKRDIISTNTPRSSRDEVVKEEGQDGMVIEVEEESFPWIS